MPEPKKHRSFISGDDVKIWRISRDLKQEELGTYLGIGRTAVGEIEKRGGDQILALALAALDRGLQPVTISIAERKAFKKTDRKIIRQPEAPAKSHRRATRSKSSEFTDSPEHPTPVAQSFGFGKRRSA